MRYSIMLQLVVTTTLILGGAAAFFAWLQNRPVETEAQRDPLEQVWARDSEPQADAIPD